MNLVKHWYCSREARSGEPLIVLETVDGRELAFMLPSVAAEQLGLALVQQGQNAAPAHGALVH